MSADQDSIYFAYTQNGMLSRASEEDQGQGRLQKALQDKAQLQSTVQELQAEEDNKQWKLHRAVEDKAKLQATVQTLQAEVICTSQTGHRTHISKHTCTMEARSGGAKSVITKTCYCAI